jgi:GAF domain-containing protein
LCAAFVEFADALNDQFHRDDLPHVLTDTVVSTTEASSAGLVLVNGSYGMQFVTASDPAAAELEQRQLDLGEGPCLDCCTGGEPVIVSDLNTTDQWPRFVEVALGMGIQSVHAVPMRFRRNAIGALNIFSAAPLPFDDDDIAVVQAIADVATIAILQERAVASAELLTEQLQHALNSRIMIEQAKGFVARTHGISVDQAFDMLRSYAHTNQVRLTDLCLEVVDRKVSIAVPPEGIGRPRPRH